MRWLLVLLLPLGFVHAGPVVGTSDVQYLLYTKDELAKAGYLMRDKGGEVQAENRDKGVQITMSAFARTAVLKLDGKLGAYDLKLTNRNQYLSLTMCKPEEANKATVLCRTINADYCNSLVGQTKWRDVDLSQLKKCDEILSKLDYHEDDVRLVHEEAMGRISKINGVEMANFKSAIGKPRSLGTLLDDYALCSELRSGWAPPRAPAQKSDRLESHAER